MTEQLYTTSRVRAWNSCKLAHHYRYELGIRTPSGPAAEFGTLLHAALEAWYLAWLVVPDGSTRQARAFDTINDLRCDELTKIKLRALVVGYTKQWGSEDWEVIAVEAQFRYKLRNDITGRLFNIGGKIDALIRERATGKRFLVEHKSSSQDTSEGSPYWQKLQLDEQISIYHDGAEFGLSLPVDGCVYDVIKRPQHELLEATPADRIKYTVGRGCKGCGGSGGGKLGIVQGRGYYESDFGNGDVRRSQCNDCKGTGWKCDADGVPQEPRPYAETRLHDETIDEFEDRVVNDIASRLGDYFQRATIVRLDSELPRMRQNLLDTLESMEALAALNLAPPNHSACSMGREMCGFFAACANHVSIDDERIYPRDEIHPELVAITNIAT